MRELLRLENITYTYQGGHTALCGISTAFYAGERVAVIGSNGAGKSTLFLCCNGVLTPSAGTLSLEETPLRTASERKALRKAVGLVFQDPETQLLAGTVAAEISFGPMNLRLSEQEVRRRVADALKALSLETLRERAPHTLSGGEKKRVCLADLLAMEPALLLLDEPTASLDHENAHKLEQQLYRLSDGGLGLVISTHDVDFVWRWAQRVLVLDHGRLLADAAPEEIFSDEALLSRCALQAPLLYLVGKRLGLSPLPRTPDEIPQI